MTETRLLKKDLFGEIRRVETVDGIRIIRDTLPASVWVGWLARAMLRREARVLAALADVADVPHVIHYENYRLERDYLAGRPLHEARTSDPAYFRAAARLLRRLHRSGVVHNDLAKEPNLLVQDDGTPAFIDFQLAWYTRHRGRLFRLLGWDDIRHLLKHKRSYCPQHLTQRERRILETPSIPSRIFRATLKPLYTFVTRRLLGWADREGAGDRGEQR